MAERPSDEVDDPEVGLSLTGSGVAESPLGPSDSEVPRCNRADFGASMSG